MVKRLTLIKAYRETVDRLLEANNLPVRWTLYFLALATDYDGTLATNDLVAEQTCGALRRFKDSGRRLVLVTGRELPELKRVFPEIALFDRVVAENGALIYDPATGQERLLAPPVPPEFARRLRERIIAPVSCGRVIVSTWEPHQAAVLDLIRELGLELQIVFNKGAVMIMPPGVNKASGFLSALKELDLAPQNVVAVGDAENDHTFLSACGFAAAVANALPIVKSEVDLVLKGDHGSGVVELIDTLIREDANMASKIEHGVLVGVDRDGNGVHIEPYRGNVLIMGPSQCGKSTLATVLTERMAEKHFEFCVIDPEGDYIDLKDAMCVGSRDAPPSLTEAIKLLDDVEVNLIADMQALDLRGRWTFFSRLLMQTALLRARTGRPHWLIIDEAHEVLSKQHDGAIATMPPNAAIFVTAYPQALAASAIKTVDVVIALGDTALQTLTDFGRAFGMLVPADVQQPASDEVLVWTCRSGQAPIPVRIERPVQKHKRHAGKYAVGDVGPERSFYFRNPQSGTTLKAENLYRFMEIACAVDDGTWERHLRAGDYSAWFRDVIKDEPLAHETQRVEAKRDLEPQITRNIIRQAIWDRYAALCQV